MKFSLVHPSRQRTALAEAAIREWHGSASGKHEIEHVLSVDADDSDLDGYRQLADRLGLRLVTGPNKTMVEAVNRGAAATSGDVLVSISDDFGCPPHWDEAIAQAMAGRGEAALFVHDGLDGRIMTLPILSRGFYRRTGFVYHPSYISMFADDDLTELARVTGATVDVRSALTFPHRHVSHDLAPNDATYARQNSNRSWWHGWRTFELRRVDNFGPPAPGLAAAWARVRIESYYAIRTGGARVRRRLLGFVPRPVRHLEWRLRGAVLRGVALVTAMKVRD